MGKKGEKSMETFERGEVNAFLGGETSVEGKLNYTGAVIVDGRFKGGIYSDDVLVVGETAKIEGEINVGTVVIQGEVVGNINASVKVEVHHPGKVIGDISTPSIMIDDGAIFDGNCKMKEVKKVEKKGEKEIGLFPRKKEAEAQEEEKKVERAASDLVL